MTEQLLDIGTPVRLKADNRLGTIVDGGTATPFDYVVAIWSSREHVDVAHSEVVDLHEGISQLMWEAQYMFERLAQIGIKDSWVQKIRNVQQFKDAMLNSAAINDWQVHQTDREAIDRLAENYVLIRERLKNERRS